MVLHVWLSRTYLCRLRFAPLWAGMRLRPEVSKFYNSFAQPTTNRRRPGFDSRCAYIACQCKTGSGRWAGWLYFQPVQCLSVYFNKYLKLIPKPTDRGLKMGLVGQPTRKAYWRPSLLSVLLMESDTGLKYAPKRLTPKPIKRKSLTQYPNDPSKWPWISSFVFLPRANLERRLTVEIVI